MIRVSIGTAGALNLARVKQSVLPTTAYLLVGDRCTRRCRFCAQSAGAAAEADQLSRITWPQYPLPQIISALDSSKPAPGHWQRICLQTTVSRNWEQITLDALASFKRELPDLPICVSIQPAALEQVEKFLRAGADRVTMPLDAVEPNIYGNIKQKDWYQAYNWLLTAARKYPGRIGTHIIIGLGETEQAACLLLASLIEAGITVGLFAFTPIRGTELEHKCPPKTASYRRIQIVLALLRSQIVTHRSLVFNNGKLVQIEADRHTVLQELWSGEAFRTSGCPGCNRPYFNERPGTVLYNYPYAPTEEEIQQALLESGLFTPYEIESTKTKKNPLPNFGEN